MTAREGQSALFFAVNRRWVNAVGYLIEHGADVSLADARGNTALYLARTAIDGLQARTGDNDEAVTQQLGEYEEITRLLRQNLSQAN
jgi:hypothetical protein